MKLRQEHVSANSPDVDHPRLDSGSVTTYLKLRHRVRAVALTLMVVGFWAAAGWQGPDSRSNEVKEVAPAKAAGRVGNALDEAVQTFQRFAVNALVIPLIDDDVTPPRWTLQAMDWICDGRGVVAIDDKPLVAGDPVPTGNFQVHWNLKRCPPLQGGELLVEGDITLAVSNSGTDLRAQIFAANLSVETFAGGRRVAPDSAWTSAATAP